MNRIIENNKPEIIDLCKQYHIALLYVFGSVVSDDFTDKSDIDLLYKFDYSGFDFNHLENVPYDPFLTFFDFRDGLEALLKRKVDLIPYQDFKNSYFKSEVEKTKKIIYAAERFEEIPA